MGEYFDCVCCGSVDMGDAGDQALCDPCKLCECGSEGDEPRCKELLVDSGKGAYIPQIFAHNMSPEAWGISPADIEALKSGPNNEEYWDAWDNVEGYVERDFEGKRWVLVQENDLWAQCVGKASGRSN